MVLHTSTTIRASLAEMKYGGFAQWKNAGNQLYMRHRAVSATAGLSC